MLLWIIIIAFVVAAIILLAAILTLRARARRYEDYLQVEKIFQKGYVALVPARMSSLVGCYGCAHGTVNGRTLTVWEQSKLGRDMNLNLVILGVCNHDLFQEDERCAFELFDRGGQLHLRWINKKPRHGDQIRQKVTTWANAYATKTAT